MPYQRALVGMRAGRLAALVHIQKHVDFRIARMAILIEHVDLQLAEAAAEGDVLCFIDVLVGKDEQQVPTEASRICPNCRCVTSERSTPRTCAPITVPSLLTITSCTS